MASSDIPWRRPGDAEQAPATPYLGPPALAPASPDWQVPVHETVAPPRPLPAIDHDALDQAETDATNVTYLVGLTALGMLLLITIWNVF